MNYSDGIREILAGEADTFTAHGRTFTRRDALASIGRDRAAIIGLRDEYDEVILGIHPQPRPAARA